MKKTFKFFALLAAAFAVVALVACSKTTETEATKKTTSKQETTTVSETVAHEHAWDEGTVTKEATCSEEGVKTFTCACGETKTEAIPMIAHTEVDVEAVPATCTESGLTAGKKCSVCDAVIVAQETIDATGHTYGEAQQSNAHIVDGYIEMVKTCATCGNKEAVQTINLAQYNALAHNVKTNVGSTTTYEWDATTMTLNVKALPKDMNPWANFTFNACSTKAKYAYIVVEGSADVAVGLKVDADGIPYDGLSGNKVYKGISNKTEVVVWDLDALGIDSTKVIKFVLWAYQMKDATATTGTIKVLAAGLANTAEEISAIHNYNTYESDAEGHIGKCVCGATIAKVAHTEEDIAAVPATCTETGLSAGKKCSVCGYVTVAQQTIPANGHSYTEVALVEATPLATGVAKHYTCANCDMIFDADKAPTTADALVIAKVTPKTVAEAIAEANDGVTETVFVKGYVKNGTISSNGIQLYLVDEVGNEQIFQIYNGSAADDVDQNFKPGSLVIAKGNYAIHNNKAELISATVISVEHPTVTTNYGTAEAPLTVTQAYSEIANCIISPTDECYIKGYVTGIDNDKKKVTISDMNGSGKDVIVYFPGKYEGNVILGQYVNVVGQYKAYFETMQVVNATITYTTDFGAKLSDGTTPICQYIGTDVLSFKTYIGINNITKFDYANGSVIATNASTLKLNNCFLNAIANEGAKYLTIVLNVQGGESFNHITIATFNSEGWVSPDVGGYYKDMAASDGTIRLEFTVAELAGVISDSDNHIEIFTRNKDEANNLVNVDSNIEIKSIDASQYKVFTMKQNAVDFSNDTYNENKLLTGVTITAKDKFVEGGGLDKSYFDYLVAQGYKFVTMTVAWNVADPTSLGAIRYPKGNIDYGKPTEVSVDLADAITNELLFWVPFNGGADFDRGNIVLSNITYYTSNPLRENGLILKVRDFNNETVDTNQRFGIDLQYYGSGYTGAVGSGTGQIGALVNESNEKAQVLVFNRFGGLTKKDVVFFSNHMNIVDYGTKDVSYEGDVVVIPAGTYKDPDTYPGVNRKLVLEESLYYYCPSRGSDFIRMADAEALLTKLTTVSQTGNVWQSFDNLIYLANLLGYTKIKFHADPAAYYANNAKNCTEEGFTNYRFVITCNGGEEKDNYWQINGFSDGGLDCVLDFSKNSCSVKTTFTIRCWHETTKKLSGHSDEGTGCWKNLDSNCKITNITLEK